VIRLVVAVRRFALREAFVISRGSRTEVTVVEALLDDGRHRGLGECVPYARYGESVRGVVAALERMGDAVARGLDREALQDALPPGAARNALDCAFWDLAAKRASARVWELPAWHALGGPAPAPVTTAYTLSIGTPSAMREAATLNAHRPILKVKLAGDAADVPRVEAVRAGAPASRLVVAANEGWSAAGYAEAAEALAALGVELVEQPLPAEDDAALDGLPRPVALCADESCHDRATLDALAGRYDAVNIKLDKTGGLTEALALRAEAERRGFAVMIGCMMGSSLGCAPAALLGAGATLVDLDPPLLLAEDRAPALPVEGAAIHPPDPALWG